MHAEADLVNVSNLLFQTISTNIQLIGMSSWSGSLHNTTFYVSIVKKNRWCFNIHQHQRARLCGKHHVLIQIQPSIRPHLERAELFYTTGPFPLIKIKLFLCGRFLGNSLFGCRCLRSSLCYWFFGRQFNIRVFGNFGQS